LQLFVGCGSPTGVTLDQLPIRTPAQIVAVDWAALVPEEAQRLQALGLEVGAQVQLAYRGVFMTRDPLAVEVGRMTVALRRAHGQAMEVELVPADSGV